jgi:hypothetical protein
MLATVYADRVKSVAKRTGANAGRLIGRAMAHEIGHLLLGTSHHSVAGLMRARWSDGEVQRDLEPDWALSSQDIDKQQDAQSSARVEPPRRTVRPGWQRENQKSDYEAEHQSHS